MNKKKAILLALLALVALFAVACQPTETVVTKIVEVPGEEVVVTQVVEVAGETVIEEVVVTATPDPNAVVEEEPVVEEPGEPVTLYQTDTSDIPELDPQIATDATSITYIENLFVALTNYDLETAEVVPEAATSWEISEDGLTYTFHLRTDIPWVKYNPTTRETTQEVDPDGNPRFVTASDFVYGIKRACDPNTGGGYSYVIAPHVLGCADVLDSEDPAAIPPELMDAIGVAAPDPATLVIQLENPAGFFLSMTPMWIILATPQWAIENYGETWTEAGTIVTNGRYVLTEWVHNVRATIQRNPLMPADMAGSGNIERRIVSIVPDITTGYSLWLNGQIDTSAIPPAELDAHLQNYADETVQQAGLTVFYFGFRTTKPPFDDVRVRRAFSAAFDRATFITEVRAGQGLPMAHFAPPGIFGAPLIDQVGVGFDPEFAAAQLAEAGYPNCEGFPQINLVAYSGAATLSWIEFAQANWSQNLGCPVDLIQIEQVEFDVLLDIASDDTPDEESPHVWTLGWGPDYADENNWVGDVLWCESPGFGFKRACSAVDDLIVEARTEQDPARRIELYAQIEEMFFGPEGEYPIAPLFLRIAYVAQHSWYTNIPALFGGNQFYNYTIDQEAQLAARGAGQ